MKKDILLSKFNPVSEAVVEEHLYEKPRFPVIDIHTHMGALLLGPEYEKRYDTAEFMESMRKKGVVKLCNMDGSWGEEFERMQRKTAGFAEDIFHFVWINSREIDSGDFGNMTARHIEESVKRGARGIKMWKDISLNIRDRSGKYLRTDDTRFDTVYDTAAKLGIPVLVHIADPVAFFRPLDGHNERFEQLNAHPEWHFYRGGRYTFEQLMEMQDAMIEKHPGTVFIVAHFGSYPENLKHVAERLERYPNMYIDIAARIAELGRVPMSARKFFIRYRERILFGSDCTPFLEGEHETAYRFLESTDEYFSYSPDNNQEQGRWRIYGLGLPDDVLECIYNKNAMKILKTVFNV
jgi:predicted TIM-barrel fold metal-dependent hydrolase